MNGDDVSGIKVGDVVALCDSNGQWSRVTVSRLTRTQAEIEGSRFRLKDGRSVGTASWYHSTIHLLTPETEALIRATEERRWKHKVCAYIREKLSASLPIDTLKAIKELLDKEAK